MGTSIQWAWRETTYLLLKIACSRLTSLLMKLGTLHPKQGALQNGRWLVNQRPAPDVIIPVVAHTAIWVDL